MSFRSRSVKIVIAIFNGMSVIHCDRSGESCYLWYVDEDVLLNVDGVHV